MTVSETISSYRKRRKTPTPLVIGLLAVILVLVGIIILILSLGGRNGLALFATDTPTPSITPSPTNTSTPTETSTTTPTATITLTATPSAPYQYVIQQGDNLEKIAKDHGLGDFGVVLTLLLNPYNPTTFTGIEPIAKTIYVGQTIWLPPPGMPYPTATPLPTGLAPGTKIIYVVLPGDNLGIIARKFNSTTAAIAAANKDLLPDGEATGLEQGWPLWVPINLVKPTQTAISTATPSLTPTP